LGWIRSSLTETIQAQISSCRTSIELWTSLKQSFFATSRARLTDLRCQLHSAHKGSSSCTNYFQKMRHLADELAFIGNPISDDDLVIGVLNGLGPEYNPFVVSFTTANQTQPLSFSNLHDTLLTF
jgi:gag-polypeptide of LTR copia-type